MNWNVFKRGKRGKRRQPSISKAYEESFLEKYSEIEPEKILSDQTKKTIAVVAGIRDQGIDERNRLKAAKVLLDRMLPEKHEIKGEVIQSRSPEERSALLEVAKRVVEEIRGIKSKS